MRLFLIVGQFLFCGFLSEASSQDFVWQQEEGYRWSPLVPRTSEEVGFSRLPASESGITFRNELSQQDINANFHYLNGSGVAAGDVDGDGLVDLYLAKLDGSNRLYKNLGGLRFRDVTESTGVAHQSYYSTGVVFADIDGDRDQDLLVASMHKGVTSYLNDGSGQFERLENSGLNSTQNKGNTTLALADIDGDQDLDLYVTNYKAEPVNRLFSPQELAWENTVRRTGNSYELIPPFDQHYIIVRIDGELTRVELAEEDQLFLNNGDGTFTEVMDMDQQFLTHDGTPQGMFPDWGLTANFRDINQDGWPDLYVCNDVWTPDRVWINQGDGTFRAINPLAIRNFPFSSMTMDYSDINRDGHLDMFVTEMLSSEHQRRLRQFTPDDVFPSFPGQIDNQPQYNRNALYLNRGDNTFAEISYFSGLEATEWSWATRFMDLDLDGYEDLIVTTGFPYDVQDMDAIVEMSRNPEVAQRPDYEPPYPRLNLANKIFRNNGNLSFSDKSSRWGFTEPDITNGMAAADLDNDGDLELIMNRFNGEAAVYENRTGAPRIAIRLVGQQPNTGVIGAKIKLSGGAVVQQEEVSLSGDYLSGSDPLTIFAATDPQADYQFTITWPGGLESVIEGIQLNRLYEIDETKIDKKSSNTDAPLSSEKSLFVDVSNEINHSHFESTYDDFGTQPLLPGKLSQQGPGISWIDYDEDGDDDLFIGTGRGGKLAIYENTGSGTFTERSFDEINTAAQGDQITILGWQSGGQTTLFVGASNYETRDIRSPSAFAYSIGEQGDHSMQSLPGSFSTTSALAAADYDGDGDLDLFLGGGFVPGHYPMDASSRLFRNDDGQFVLDKSNSQNLNQIGLVSGAVFSDYDGDGDKDLFLSRRWDSILLLQNDGGTFQDISEESGLTQHKGWWNGVATGDFNNDGRPDLVATNRGLNSPYQLTGEEPLKMFYRDFNNDSRVDIIEAHFDSAADGYVPIRQLQDFKSIPSVMYPNIRSHKDFADATLNEILGYNADQQLPSKEINMLSHLLFINEGDYFSAHPLPDEAQFSAALSANVADFDNDGNEDLFLSQNLFPVYPKTPRLDAGRSLLLKGDGRGNLQPVLGQRSGLKVYGDQRGAALADFNQDSRVDLAVSQNAAATTLYENRYPKAGITVRLQGASSNSAGIGSSIRLIYADGTKGPRREIQAGSGHWSQNSPTQVLGYNKPVKAIEVTWFDGRVTMTAVTRDQSVYQISYQQ